MPTLVGLDGHLSFCNLICYVPVLLWTEGLLSTLIKGFQDLHMPVLGTLALENGIGSFYCLDSLP